MKVIQQTILLLILLGQGTMPSLKGAESLATTIKAVKPSVVTVIAYYPNTVWPSFGTGIVVSPDRVATARHVIAGAQWAEIKLPNGRFFRVKALSSDSEAWDLAVLQIVTNIPDCAPLELETDLPSEGDSVFLIGNPNGLEWTISNGIVSAIRDIPGVGLLVQHTAPAFGGNSGGPLFNERGHVVAIDTSSLTNSGTLNFAIPSNHISNLLKTPSQFKSLAEFSKGIPAGWRPLSTTNVDIASLRPITLQQPKASLQFFQECAARNPKDANALNSLGLCQHELADYAGAIASFSTAIDLDPSFTNAYLNRGTAYNWTTQPLRALEDLKRVVKSDGTNANAFNAMGWAYLQNNELEKAIESCRKAVAINPRYTDAHRNLGDAYLRSKRTAMAFEEFRGILNIEPTDEHANATLGLLAMEQGQFSAAIGMFERAISSRPDQPFWVYRELGKAYDKLAQMKDVKPADGKEFYEKELGYLKSAINKNSGDSESQYLLGKRLLAMLRYDEAVPFLETAALALVGPAEAHQFTHTPYTTRAYLSLGHAYAGIMFQKGTVEEMYAWALKAAKAYEDSLKYPELFLKKPDTEKLSPDDSREAHEQLVYVYALLDSSDHSFREKALSHFKVLASENEELARNILGIIPEYWNHVGCGEVAAFLKKNGGIEVGDEPARAR